jgi:hypothetical protein
MSLHLKLVSMAELSRLARGGARSPTVARSATRGSSLPARGTLWEEGGAGDWSLLLEIQRGDEDEEDA